MSEEEDDARPPASSIAVATSESARQKRKIAQLEEKLQVLESGQAAKQRYGCRRRFCSACALIIFREINYYMSKGRAIRRIVVLYDNIEDLISENDRRCDGDGDDNATPESVFCVFLVVLPTTMSTQAGSVASRIHRP
jgi:hypothetical protein